MGAPQGFNEWEDNEAMIKFHLHATQAQLFQAYIGMALAVAAKRAFISPKFQCYCDKCWYAVDKCRMADGRELQFPYTCPTDYLFQPDHFADAPGEHGPTLDFREPSFLDNPRTPPEVKNAVLTIVPSEGLDCTNCTRKEEVENGTTLLIVPARLRDRELLPLLEPYSHYRVWRLSFAEVLLLPRAYGGFACKGDAESFDRRMGHITTDWCCRYEEEAVVYNKLDQLNEPYHMPRMYSAAKDLDEGC